MKIQSTCFLYFIFIAFQLITAQPPIDTFNVDIDLLRAPSSPAAVLLGISSSEIENPSDPVALLLSLQNASDDFTRLPSRYAVDFGLMRVFGPSITYENLQNAAGWPCLTETVFSLATRTDRIAADSALNTTSIAAGLEIPIVRGWLNKEFKDAVTRSTDMLKPYHAKFTKSLDSLIQYDSLYQFYDGRKKSLAKEHKTNGDEFKFVIKLAELRMNEIREKAALVDSIGLDSLKKIAEGIRLDRWGPILNCAFGITEAFPSRVFTNHRFAEFGAWVIGGYDLPSAFTFLGLVRYLYMRDSALVQRTTSPSGDFLNCLDFGMRGLYSRQTISLSAEGVYRRYLEENLDPLWGFRIVATCDIGQNKKLCFTWGKELAGKAEAGGDLLTAINLLVGFGSSLRIKP